MLLFSECGLLLGLAVALGTLAARLGLPKVVGELAAGILLGPSVLGPSALGSLSAPALAWARPVSPDQFHLVDAVAQFSLILLVGLTGLDVDLGLVRRRRNVAARIGLSGLVVPLALGVAVGFLAPASLFPASSRRLTFALFVGVALAVSAIPVIAKILSDMGLTHRNVGQLVLATAMIDDVCGWLLLSAVAAIAAGGTGPAQVLWSSTRPVLLLALAIGPAIPLLRFIMRRALRRASAGAAAPAVFVTALLLAAAVTQGMHLEAMVGAFLTGVIVGTVAGAPAALRPLGEVVTAVLAPFFFATAGLRVDLRLLAGPPVLAMALLVFAAAIAGKLAGTMLGAAGSGMSRWEKLGVGAGLNARGVIQIVIASTGLSLGVLTTSAYTILIGVAVATSVMAVPLLRIAFNHIETDAEELSRLRRRELDGSDYAALEMAQQAKV